MAMTGRRRWPACRVRSRCLWWRASTPPSRCTAASWRTRNSAREALTPSSWSGSSNGRNTVASSSLPKSSLPRLYPILDAGLLIRAGLSVEGFARELRRAGIRFLQYRDKEATDKVVLERAALLRTIFPDSCLILNDRVSLVSTARYDGIHVGQEDLSPAQ